MAEPDLLALAGAPTPAAAASGRPTDADLTKGHRERLRERLFENPESLQDYELLEYLLAVAIPRRDTKRTAKLLLQRFGSIGQVFAAEPRFLKDVEGMGDVTAAAIKIAHATALFMLKSRAREAPILSSWQALADYLHADMAHDLVERFRVLHLNTRNMLVRDEVMSRGTIDEAAVHVREVVKRALDLQSAALILVHNHPSGDPSPSKADIAMTRAIIDAGRPLNIAVHDHIIVGLNGQVSFRSKGLI